MHLFIQIPCLNEVDHIGQAIAGLPKQVQGFERISVLVIDDGSDDATSQAASLAGADFIVRNSVRQGLARAYLRGLEECLARGADVIVNYDADGQYRAECIPDLVAPILSGDAELVVGARPIGQIEHFSWCKKFFQRLGSTVVRQASGLKVADATSGFRAVTRKAAAKLFVYTRYTYTLETLIQAGRLNLPVRSVPIGVNPPRRASRLMKNSADYMLKSAITLVRVSFLYYPLRIMFWSAVAVGTPGVLVILRFLAHYFEGDGGGRIQSLVLGSTLVGMSLVLFIGGVLADLIAANRALLQEIRARQLESRFRADV